MIEVADERPREGGASVAQLAAREGLGPLPELPFPAQIVVERMVGPGALVAFDGNRYSVPPGLVGRTVAVRARLGAATIEILAASGAAVATHRRAPAGAGQLIRTQPHLAELERAVLDAFTTRKPCRRKANRPPGATAQAAAARLLARPEAPASVVVDLAAYAELAEAAR